MALSSRSLHAHRVPSVYHPRHASRARNVRFVSHSGSRSLKTTTRPQDEQNIFGTGLIFGKVKPIVIRSWVIFQSIALFCQWILLNEVRNHLNNYDLAVQEQCSGTAHSRHGVCLGPMWNLTSWQDVALEGQRTRDRFRINPKHHKYLHHHRLVSQDDDAERVWEARKQDMDEEIEELETEEKETNELLKELKKKRNALRLHKDLDELASNASHTFDFFTFSVPPTFLVVVDPVAVSTGANQAPPEANLTAAGNEKMENVAWSLKVSRVDPLKRRDFHLERTGPDVITFEDLSPEAEQATEAKKQVHWRATLTNRGWSERQIRFKAFVEDSSVPHLAGFHSISSNCNFIQAWKAFNRQYQGRSHESLVMCRFFLGAFLPLGAMFIFIVHKCAFDAGVANAADIEDKADAIPDRAKELSPEDDDCYCFHASVCVKFFIVDIPQQICIVLYMLGWYEGEGLRCQLCLFHLDKCGLEHPFKVANSAALICTLLSSGTNQLLVRPTFTSSKSDEDACFRYMGRLIAMCVSTLPITTGTFWATGALLSTPVLAQVVFFIPCALGWLTVAALLLRWIFLCCQECE